MSKEYIAPKTKKEFRQRIVKTRGVHQTYIKMFDEIFEDGIKSIIKLACTSKPFGIKTTLQIVKLGKSKQKQFMKWYVTGKFDSKNKKYGKYPIRDVKLWIAAHSTEKR